MDGFGSIARGAPHEGSDVDLLVEFSPEANAGLFEMGDLKEELEERLGCPVDLVSLGAVEKSRNPVRRREILSNRVTIYARRKAEWFIAGYAGIRACDSGISGGSQPGSV